MSRGVSCHLEPIPLNAGEIWAIVGNCNSMYLVSNQGRVYSYFSGKMVNTQNMLSVGGYHQVSISFDGRPTKKVRVHRVVAEAFIPNPENKPQVNHINGIKTDNRVENLEWCTARHNRQHAADTGLLGNKGSKHVNSKLTEAQAAEILDKSEYMTQREIAAEYSVSPTIIWCICNGRTWKHVARKKDYKPFRKITHIQPKRPPVSRKLTDAQVVEIRALAGEPQDEVARKYNISQSFVSAIQRGEAYRQSGGNINTQTHPPRIVSDADVRWMRAMKGVIPLSQISIKLGISKANACLIQNGKIYQDVQ